MQFTEQRQHCIDNLKSLDFAALAAYFFMNYHHVLGSGFVTDEEVKQRELKLRDALKNDRQFQVKEGASVEVAQVRSIVKSVPE